MERVRSADVYDVNRRVGQHRFVIIVDLERSPILSLQLFFVLLPSRTDGCDLGPWNFVEGGDVRPGDPAQSDYANIDIIHSMSSPFYIFLSHIVLSAKPETGECGRGKYGSMISEISRQKGYGAKIIFGSSAFCSSGSRG